MSQATKTEKCRTGLKRWLTCICALCFAAAACGDSENESRSSTTVAQSNGSEEAADGGDPETTQTAETTPELEDTDEPASTTEPPESSEPGDAEADHDSGLDVDPAWEKREALWFVWNVEPDDVLNVRAEPDAESAVLAELAHDARGITRYSEEVVNGDTAWGVVESDGRTGWVALRFLRPEPSTVEQINEPPSALLPGTMQTMQGALGDRAALAEYVGPNGLLLSPDGFVSNDDVVLSADDIAMSGPSRIWGVEAGSGASIEMTVDDYFEWLRGSTALTSTEVTSYDAVVGQGSTINNIDQFFPGSSTVEYHHGGTSYYGGLDWESVRFVFDLGGDAPVLLAIVSDAWTP